LSAVSCKPVATGDASRILVFGASLRTGSLNQQLATLAARRLRALGAAVTELDLGDHPLPIYNGNFDSAGSIPAEALALHACLRSHEGVFIASPEYNSAIPPLLVNVLNWVSRVTEHGGMTAAFAQPVFALGSASPGSFGGYRGLVALRQMLELGLAARVLPAMISVPQAHEVFDDAGELLHSRTGDMLDRILGDLVAASRMRMSA
jgi:chromate reductase, NAD(P)H dehydrogenase (quinone)